MRIQAAVAQIAPFDSGRPAANTQAVGTYLDWKAALHQDQDIAAGAAIVDTNVVVAKADRPRPPRIGLIALAFGGILRPATAARRTAHLPLSSAFVIHALSCVLILFTILFLMGWEASSTRPDAGLRELWTKITVKVGLAEAGFSKKWVRDYGIPAAAAAVAIELGIILLALVLASWGAIDETLRSMWTNGLRQIWLLAPCALYAVAAVGSMGVALDRGERVLRASLRADGHGVFIHRGKDGTRYFVDGETLRRVATIPWYYTYSKETTVTYGFVTLGWLFWGLLARIGARPPSAKPDRPPLCEACGYNIIGIAADGRCPECGQAVATWLASESRAGAAWHARRGPLDLRVWVETTLQLLSGPKTFGMRLRRWPGDHAHRSYFALSLPFVFIAAYVGVSLFYFVSAGRSARFIDYALIVAPIGASICTVVAVLVTTCAAGVSAVWFRFTHRESVAAPAMQAAGYASSLLPVLCMGACLLFTFVAAVWRWVERIAGNLGIFPGLLIVLVFFAIIVGALLLYARLVGRVTSGMLYANR